MADDAARLAPLAPPCTPHHDVDRAASAPPLYTPPFPSQLFIDTTLSRPPSPAPSLKKRKLTSAGLDPPDFSRHCCFASYAGLGYPSPPATAASLRCTVSLPALDGFHQLQHQHHQLFHDRDHDHEPDRPRMPSPPPTLAVRAHALPHVPEAGQAQYDFRVYPGLPTPVSPVRDTRLWDASTEDDARAYDRDFPPLSGLFGTGTGAAVGATDLDPDARDHDHDRACTPQPPPSSSSSLSSSHLFESALVPTHHPRAWSALDARHPVPRLRLHTRSAPARPLPRDSVELIPDTDAEQDPLTPISLPRLPPFTLCASPLQQSLDLSDADGDGPMDIDDGAGAIAFRDPFGDAEPDPDGEPPPASPRRGPLELELSMDLGHDLSMDLDLDAPSSPRAPPTCLPPDADADASPPCSPSRRQLTALPELGLASDAPDTPAPPDTPSSPCLRSFPCDADAGTGTGASLLPLDLVPACAPTEPLPGSGPDPSAPSLGLFVPLSAPSSAPAPASAQPDNAPDLDFPPAARARVDAQELAGLLALRRRTWFAERNAKRAELDAADAVRALAAGVRLSPPVPGALAECDREPRGAFGVLGTGGAGGVGLGAGGGEDEGAGALRRRIQALEARRAEARRERKAFKDRGREVQCLLRFALGETVREREHARAKEGCTDADKENVRGKEREKEREARSRAQLVARMVLKRREVARPLGGRRVAVERVLSPLVPCEDDEGGGDEGLFEGDVDDDWGGRRERADRDAGMHMQLASG